MHYVQHVKMHKILRKQQHKISYREAMLNRSLLSLSLYIQPPKHVLHFYVRQFHAWILGLSISRPSILCLDILMVRHFHVRHFQRPRPEAVAETRMHCAGSELLNLNR